MGVQPDTVPTHPAVGTLRRGFSGLLSTVPQHVPRPQSEVASAGLARKGPSKAKARAKVAAAKSSVGVIMKPEAAIKSESRLPAQLVPAAQSPAPAATGSQLASSLGTEDDVAL